MSFNFMLTVILFDSAGHYVCVQTAVDIPAFLSHPAFINIIPDII